MKPYGILKAGLRLMVKWANNSSTFLAHGEANSISLRL